MTLALVIEPLAQDDIDAHTAYSDDLDPTAGDRFLAELKEVARQHVAGRCRA